MRFKNSTVRRMNTNRYHVIVVDTGVSVDDEVATEEQLIVKRFFNILSVLTAS